MNIVAAKSGTNASKAGFFSSIKIGTKIAAGFSIVLLLMAALSIASILGIRGLVANFDSYALVSKQTLTGALVDGNVNDIRQKVRLFVNTGEKSTVDQINKHYDEVMKSVADTLAVTRRADWQQMLKEIQENLRGHRKDFTHLVELRTKYAAAVARMDDVETLAYAALKKADSAADEANTATSNQTMELIEDFLLARINALHYRAEPDEKYATAFGVALKKMDAPRKNVQNSGFEKVVQLESVAIAAVGDYEKATREMMSLAGEIDKLTTGPMEKRAERIDSVGEKLRAAQNEDNAQKLADSNAAEARTQMLVIGFAIGGLILGLTLAWLISRMISKPLIKLVRPIEELARGNFAVTVPVTGRKDEIGQIADAVAQMAETVSATLAEIKASGREVTNASAEISTSTTDLSQRTEEQAASLEETSASMEEIAATVKKNAENARQANEFATETNTVAEHGGAVVGNAVTAMARIEESSRKISDIIGVIDEIARQTNLLALNAAVEAARAGEAGRGFAVVASEVRSLAQRSSQAAKDIKDLITNSNSQVKDGVDLVNKAGESLNAIMASIKKVTDIVADIANASMEQSAGIEQINKALTQMDEVTQQNSALVEENAATAKTLEHQARAMDERVAFFQIGDAGEAGAPRAIEPAEKAAPKRMAAAPRAKAAAASKQQPVAALKQVAAGHGGGPVRRMQTAVATAMNADADWKEF